MDIALNIFYIFVEFPKNTLKIENFRYKNFKYFKIYFGFSSTLPNFSHKEHWNFKLFQN